MGELIIGGAVCVLAFSFGVMLVLQCRYEREATARVIEEAFRHLAARDAQDAVAAKAADMYQQEAIREQQIEFDRHEKQLRKTHAPVDSGRQIIRDDAGQEWEAF